MFEASKLRLLAAAVVVVGGSQGCSSAPSTSDAAAMPPNTAEVSINGNDIGEGSFVTCNQIRWLLTIDSVDDGTGFTAMIDKGGTPDAKFVKFRNLGGFTGGAWEGGVGELEANRDGAVITFTGRGYGVFADAPGEPTTAEFRIRTAC